MTVADNTSRNQYTATSGQTVFAYTFEIVDKSHIVVLKNGVALSEGTNYTVSNVGNDSGGNVTLTAGATTGDILTLYRDMPYSRTQNYTNSGDFLASEVNSDFDDLWLAGEQTNRAFSQSIRKPITDSDSISMELPEAADRASKFLTFDSTGAVSTQGASAVTTLTRQNFTGDGSTTAFTLSTAPESTGGNLQVYIDGVHQENSAYSVSGSVVTFTAAPPINSAIEVVAFATGSIGSTTADLVTYIPAGTGAVQTTVQTKLRETVSVKDFGAVGDGVTDDTAAIQAALDAAKINGDALFFPEGRYIVSSPLILPVKNGTYRVPLYLYGTSAENAPDELGSIIEYTGTSGSLFEGRGVSGTDTRRTQLKVENIQLYGTFTQGSLTNTTVGFNLYASTSLELNNVLVFGFQYGMLIEGGWWYSAINNVKFRQSKTAVKTNGAANGSVFRNCSFANVDDYSVQADYFGFSINFDNCWFEGGGITEVLLTNGGTARIQNSYFETVGTGAVVEMARYAAATGQAPMLYMTGCDIQSSGGVDHVVSLYNAAPENANMTAIFSGIWCQLTGKNGFVGASGGTNTIVYELGQINYFNNPVIPLLTPTSTAEEVKVNADGFFAKQATIISATGGVHNLENTSTAVTSGDFFGKINFVSNDASAGASGNVAGIYAKAVSDFGAVDLELYSAPSGAPMVAGLTLGSDGKVYAEIQDFVTKTSGKGLLFSGDSNIIWRAGSGTPEGAVTAPVGSMYTRSDGGASTTLYVKESGAGNTGWVAK